jgi:hypothetical protein
MLKSIVLAISFSVFVILVACQSAPTGAPISTGTSAPTSTPFLASDTPISTATVWVTPQITATPRYALVRTDDDLKQVADDWAHRFCVGQNEVASSRDWDSSNLEFTEVDIQPDPNKYWVSEIADNLDNSLKAFVACTPDLCHNQIYVKDNKTGKVYEVDWKFRTTWRPIQQVQWVNYNTLIFFHDTNPTHGQVVAINFDKKEYIYSAVAYSKSNCPIATPTVTPLPSYPLKQVLVNYTVAGFHTPYDLYFTDYALSYFVIYTDGQIIFPGNPYQQKILSKDEMDQFLTKLESLGFYKIDDPHQYNFGNKEPPRIYDGAFYCVSVTENREHSLCVYEPYETFLIPEVKNILRFLNEYQPKGMSAYSPDRILLWVQAGRNPYTTDLSKNAIPWGESSLSLETSDQKVIYADGETAKELYILYGDKSYVFTQNGREYTVDIQIVLPHQKITNLYQ